MGHLIETGTKLELKKIRHVEAMEEISYVSRFLYQNLRLGQLVPF